MNTPLSGHQPLIPLDLYAHLVRFPYIGHMLRTTTRESVNPTAIAVTPSNATCPAPERLGAFHRPRTNPCPAPRASTPPGFVEMDDQTEAEKAVKELDGKNGWVSH